MASGRTSRYEGNAATITLLGRTFSLFYRGGDALGWGRNYGFMEARRGMPIHFVQGKKA